jgi:hypothetical protein
VQTIEDRDPRIGIGLLVDGLEGMPLTPANHGVVEGRQPMVVM